MKSPESNQKEGKKTFFPTMGSVKDLNPPMADSTMSWPFVGINFGFFTRILTIRIIKNETTQLVTIELVIGKEPNRNNSVEVRLTPPLAQKAFVEETIRESNVKKNFKILNISNS